MEAATVSYSRLVRTLNRPDAVTMEPDGDNYAWNCGCTARRLPDNHQYEVAWCDRHRPKEASQRHSA
jgi:hypothetical protein